MRKILFWGALLVLANGFAQTAEKEKDLRTSIVIADTTEGWKKGGVTTINFSQTSLTNWAAGGQNSISVNGLLSVFAHYKKGNALWENYLDIGYGLINQGSSKKWWKSDDKIEMTSKYGQKAFKKWYYASLINFKSQMAPGYNYPNDSIQISNLFAPAYLLGALGLDYKPEANFSLFIAPLTAKITFVNDQNLANEGAFGVEKAVIDASTGNLITKGKNIRSEFGGYLRMSWKKEVMTNVSFQTKLDLFSNYITKPQNIDVNWENLISLKVNKYISASITTTLIYDDDITIAVDKDGDDKPDEAGPRTQFKEVLGIGFSYKF